MTLVDERSAPPTPVAADTPAWLVISAAAHCHPVKGSSFRADVYRQTLRRPRRLIHNLHILYGVTLFVVEAVRPSKLSVACRVRASLPPNPDTGRAMRNSKTVPYIDPHVTPADDPTPIPRPICTQVPSRIRLVARALRRFSGRRTFRTRVRVSPFPGRPPPSAPVNSMPLANCRGQSAAPSTRSTRSRLTAPVYAIVFTITDS